LKSDLLDLKDNIQKKKKKQINEEEVHENEIEDIENKKLNKEGKLLLIFNILYLIFQIECLNLENNEEEKNKIELNKNIEEGNNENKCKVSKKHASSKEIGNIEEGNNENKCKVSKKQALSKEKEIGEEETPCRSNNNQNSPEKINAEQEVKEKDENLVSKTSGKKEKVLFLKYNPFLF